MEDRFGVPVIEAYAMTETAYQITSNYCDRERRRPGTVGVSHGSVTVRVKNFQGTDLPPNELGEVCVKGPNVMSGYLNNEKANGSSFTTDGFFRTGDEGFINSDGYLTITGRIKEQINRGGEKISPIEIDMVLRQHQQVAEAVAFGLPDPLYGETVAVAVVPHNVSDPSLLEPVLVEYLSSRLAKYKIPQKWFFLKEIPKTSTGKVQRSNVAKLFQSSSN